MGPNIVGPVDDSKRGTSKGTVKKQWLKHSITSTLLVFTRSSRWKLWIVMDKLAKCKHFYIIPFATISYFTNGQFQIFCIFWYGILVQTLERQCILLTINIKLPSDFFVNYRNETKWQFLWCSCCCCAEKYYFPHNCLPLFRCVAKGCETSHNHYYHTAFLLLQSFNLCIFWDAKNRPLSL